MRNSILSAIAVGLSTLAIIGCATTDVPEPVANECADCARGKAGESIWCESCEKGYVSGKPVETKCKKCFVAMTGGPPCEGCAD